MQTPVDPPLPLGAVVSDETGVHWVVFAVERPTDGWPGVLIGLAELEQP